ncbi:MAG: hypothetical protein M0P61_04850 [Ignavibacteriaceae bacterium]|jgi:hypothetical protein|nr:hypothetical protein [Ignavibacteriaceae bacterium]
MSSKLIKYLLVFLMSILILAPAELQAEGNKKDGGNKLNKTNAQTASTYLDINNISSFFYNNGISDIASSGNSGFVYPKGSGRTAVFTSGLLWGAKVAGFTDPRVGGTAYRTGLVPGKVLPNGTADDPALDKYRIYRVRRDIYPGGPTVDLTSDAKNEGASATDLRTAYETDWTQWPADMGAPFEDKDGNGVYNADKDIPGIPGSDQTLWYVTNDLNSGQTTYLYNSNPLGIECQVTIWAYNQAGALGNMYFRKYKLINVTNRSALSPITFNDMYVSMWSDVDLGDAGDDFVGVDTVLSLQYCYNANATDNTYSPLPPPAVGFDFFQGPLINGVAGQDLNKNGVDDADDYGIFNNAKVGPGKINLPMTAAYYFANGDPNIGDPPQGTNAPADGYRQFYNFFQGKFGISGATFTNLVTGLPTTYALSGDPVKRTGWLDGAQLPAGDRRQGSASGPFNMAPGDTQEVVVAEIVAGAIPGVDRLSAIELLKFYDQQAQVAYDNFFNLPVAPPAPEVNVVELDKEIVLEWGQNQGSVNATESSDSKGYKFQGYNIYQLPTAFSSLSEGFRLATYDIVDGVGKISDKVFDPQTGSVVTLPVQFGNDNGLKRFISINTDLVRGGIPLVNGIKYYFAVTAYSYNLDQLAVPNNLENPLKILTVIPSTTVPGLRYGAVHGDTLKAVNSGASDGVVLPIVIDPNKLTGHNYKVNFDTLTVVDNEGNSSVKTFWKLTDVTLNKVLLDKQFNQSGDEEYQFIDGMLLKVQGPPPGMKDWDIPKGSRRFTWANADGIGFEGFEKAIGWASPASVFGSGIPGVPATKLKNVLLKLAKVPDGTVDYNPTFDLSDPNISYGYRYGRGFGGAPAKPEFAPYIINAAGGYSYQDFTKSVPLSAWDVTTDPNHPRRLAVGHLENNAAKGLVDGKWWPGNHGVYDNVSSTGPREWLWIFDADYSETPNPAFQVEAIGDPLPIMWFLTVNRRGAAPFSPANSGDDEFLIMANFVNGSADEFTFTAPAPSNDINAAKQDIEKINVFPNPYYGVNSEELNKYNRFVTFSHLPAKATIRIFNLAGVCVKTIDKVGTGQFQRWDLANEAGLPVASGLYIAYIDLPELGKTKILKVAVIQEKQILDRF